MQTAKKDITSGSKRVIRSSSWRQGACARCLVRNYNESGGDMFAVNHHFCEVAFLNKKIVEEYKEKGLL